MVYIGLLLLNTLHLHADGLSEQWRDNGTLMRLPGRFGIVMCRDKFKVISRYLCMHDIDQDYGDDRHYQLRYIIQVLNDRFKSNFQLGSYASFDKATLSS